MLLNTIWFEEDQCSNNTKFKSFSNSASSSAVGPECRKQCFFEHKSAATYHNPFFPPHEFVLLQTCNAESKRPEKLFFIFPLSSPGSLAFHRFSHVLCTGPADLLFAVYNQDKCGGDGYNQCARELHSEAISYI